MEFKLLHIAEPILKALHEEGYRTPTPIQAQAIPLVLNGHDVLGVAQTGTGKTAAFAIPVLQILSENPPLAPDAHQRKGNKSGPKHKPIRCLILTPTRELALQIEESLTAYGRHLKVSSTVIFGGVSQGAQTNALRRGSEVVVATPGRLLDLMDQGFVYLDRVEVFVLDEADRMLDMGFLRDVQKIIDKLPRDRQSLFFSATMPPVIVKLADEILFEPVRVEVAPVTSTADLIEQTLYYVEKSKKQALLMHLLDEFNIKTALVFSRTKHGADNVVRTLNRNQITAEAIHGNKSQNARQRALKNFKDGKIQVLVATDIAARGIDIDDLEHVIQYEIPNVAETYVHRIGRTGRAGANGSAIALCSSDEKVYIRDIQKMLGKKIPVVYDHPFSKPEDGVHKRPELTPRMTGEASRPSGQSNGRGKKPARSSNQDDNFDRSSDRSGPSKRSSNSSGPKNSGGPKSSGGPRSSDGPKSSGGPRSSGGPKNSDGPRSSGGQNSSESPKKRGSVKSKTDRDKGKPRRLKSGPASGTVRPRASEKQD